MKAVLISIRPEWCELIAAGKKTVEVRKTRPKLEEPFKCYIYCTIGDRSNAGDDFYVHPAPDYKSVRGNGKVIGEFVCNAMGCMCFSEDEEDIEEYEDVQLSCLTAKEILEYGRRNDLWFWNISELVIYDKPKYLGELRKPCENDLRCESCAMWSEYADRCGNAGLA